MSEFYDSLETRSTEERQQAQLRSIRNQITHVKQNTTAYKKLFGAFDAENIVDADSYSKLPLTRKSGLIELQKIDHPFGGYTASISPQATHVFVSPGPIYEPGFANDDFWRLARSLYAAGIRSGDLVHNSFSYHLTPAGMMLESGAHALGCTVIPAGTGQTELQLQTITDLKPQAYVGTPSFLKILLEKADELNMDAGSISKVLVSGEALPAPLREGFNERGIRAQQCYASADLGLIAYESSAQRGLIVDEGVYLEIVRPGSGDLVAEGEIGEVVVTSLNAEYPLIRFATGDLSMIMPGASPCGRTNIRMQGWMGRADQTAKVRGMFIHPQQIDKLVKRHAEILRARMVVSWVDQADQILLRCETSTHDQTLAASIVESIREVCKIRGEVELVEINSLPNDGKVIDDTRDYS